MNKIASVGNLVALWILVLLLSAHVLIIYPGWSVIDRALIQAGVVIGRLDAPAWVQAVGSVVAILAAIGVAWWQRRGDLLEKSLKEHQAGRIASAALLSTLPLMNLMLKIIESEAPNITFENAASRVQKYLFMLQEAELPSDEQLMNLHPVLPFAANLLVEVRSRYKQLIMLLKITNEAIGENPVWTINQLSLITQGCTLTQNNLEIVEKQLEKFFQERSQ